MILTRLECGNNNCICHTSVRRGKGLTHCPAHDDHSPSLNVDFDRGEVLVYCHAGCSQEAVVQAMTAQGIWEREHRGGIEL